jgi:hypothetical protein
MVAGDRPEVAAAAVGWPPARGLTTIASNPAYITAKARVLADRAAATPDAAALQPFTEARLLIENNAFLAAQVQADLLQNCSDPNVLARVSDSALDRPGLRAATKTDTTVRVELGEQTLRNIAKLAAELPLVDAIDLEHGPLGYALRQALPERPADDAPSSQLLQPASEQPYQLEQRK